MEKTYRERKEQCRKVIRGVCAVCSKKAGYDETDSCYSCLWKLLLDEMLEAYHEP
jgi:hypothetical protein